MLTRKSLAALLFFVVSVNASAHLWHSHDHEDENRELTAEQFEKLSLFEKIESFFLSLKEEDQYVFEHEEAESLAERLQQSQIDIREYAKAVDGLTKIRDAKNYPMLTTKAAVDIAFGLFAAGASTEDFLNVSTYLLEQGVSQEELGSLAVRIVNSDHSGDFFEAHQYLLSLKGQNTFSIYPKDLPIYRKGHEKDALLKAIEVIETSSLAIFSDTFDLVYSMTDQDRGYSLYYRADAIEMTLACLRTPGFNLDSFSSAYEHYRNLRKPPRDESPLKMVARRTYEALSFIWAPKTIYSEEYEYPSRTSVAKTVESLGLDFDKKALLEDL
ncbi:MAG: hypothetical protein AB7F43_03200 [Bacteriovoracia bacterium]